MRLRKILALSSVLFGIVGLAACNNNNTPKDNEPVVEKTYEFKDEMAFYADKTSTSQAGYFMLFNTKSSLVYEDNTLELEMGIKFQNVESTITTLNISDVKFYGNDLELKTPYYSYDYANSSHSTLASNTTLTIKKEESQVFKLYGIVPQGNEKAYFNFSFKVNGVNTTVNFYAENEVKKTCYVHNPSLNPKVLADAEEDATTVYGYKPKADGALKSYAKYDFSDKDLVAKSKAERIAYHEANNVNIKALENQLKAEGKSIEEIARACSALRNENKLASYVNNPTGLEDAKAYNLEKYGNENGPTPEYLFNKYKKDGLTDDEVWQIVLEKSYSVSAAMDAILGLYDLYFDYYKIA